MSQALGDGGCYDCGVDEVEAFTLAFKASPNYLNKMVSVIVLTLKIRA